MGNEAGLVRFQAKVIFGGEDNRSANPGIMPAPHAALQQDLMLAPHASSRTEDMHILIQNTGGMRKDWQAARGNLI